MILSFSVSNFRSFNEEETISFVASKRLAGPHDDHLIPIPDSREHALRCAVLYGANGGGKSNLFKALGYLAALATAPRPRNSGTGRTRFRLGVHVERPTSLDLQFVSSGEVFRYGVDVLDDRISEEWLAQKFGERETMIFARTTDAEGNVAVELGAVPSRNTKLSALATVGGLPNQSFLATIIANLKPDEVEDPILQVLDWLGLQLKLIGPDFRFSTLVQSLASDDELRRFVSSFLGRCSTGIEGVVVDRLDLSEADLRQMLSSDIADGLIGKFRSGTRDEVVLKRLGDDSELVAVRKDEGESFSLLSLQAEHHVSGRVGRLDWAEESDGTRRLLNLLPALYPRRASGSVFFIDEIDRSLHPILAREFVSSFLRNVHSETTQLIVTTHESSLLDQDLLRRDEVWFVEKDQNQASRIYSLADFKVRKDLEIRKHYLQGRFGAVPFIGDPAGSVLGSPEQK